MKHTPAPWTVSEIDATGEASEYYIFIEPGVAVIERKVASGDEHDMPDARLIAAAPELLAVAQELSRLMLVIESAVRHSDPRNHAAVEALLLANKAVVAKATGATP